MIRTVLLISRTSTCVYIWFRDSTSLVTRVTMRPTGFVSKNLSGRLISEFTYELIMSRDNEIAKKEKIYWTDLNDFIEITHGDPYLPLMTLDAMHCTVQEQAERRILLFERGGQFDLLCENKQTYMWVSPLPPHLLTRYSLVQRKCEDNKRVYRDMLVRNKNYQLTKLDEMFLEELKTSKKNAGIG